MYALSPCKGPVESFFQFYLMSTGCFVISSCDTLMFIVPCLKYSFYQFLTFYSFCFHRSYDFGMSDADWGWSWGQKKRSDPSVDRWERSPKKTEQTNPQA